MEKAKVEAEGVPRDVGTPPGMGRNEHEHEHEHEHEQAMIFY
jgi:hypothetical protein